MSSKVMELRDERISDKRMEEDTLNDYLKHLKELIYPTRR